MLFQFPETGDDAGKLVALLVNKRSATHGTSIPNPKARNAKARPREHHHNPEYQVLSDRASDAVEKSDGDSNADIVPKGLPLGLNLEITVTNPSGTLADPPATATAPSSLCYVPNPDNIIDHGSPDVLKLKEAKRRPNLSEDLVSTIIKVNRGTVFARDIVIWDEAAYPLSGNRLDRGERPRMPAVAKFMGSRVNGHMASEVIVQIDDVNSVDVHAYRTLATPTKGKKAAKATRETVHKRAHKGYAGPNPHVPEDTVEIVVSNYEHQRGTPVPWSLDFQWLFEVAGYGEADLAGREFDAWAPFARKYHEKHFDG